MRSLTQRSMPLKALREEEKNVHFKPTHSGGII